VRRVRRRRLSATDRFALIVHAMIVCEGSHASHEADCQRIASGVFHSGGLYAADAPVWR
jgi:hypothetical protein